MRYYFVYILSNETNVALYTGVTGDLERRLWEHRHRAEPNSYTARYNIGKLVYYETTTSIDSAIAREKQIKSWSRAKKNRLIESKNPEWKDLSAQNSAV